MSKKFYETDKFKKLQKKWYDKAAKSGFTDIEYLDSRGDANNFTKGTAATTAALMRRVSRQDSVKPNQYNEEDGVIGVFESRGAMVGRSQMVEDYLLREGYYRWAGQFYWHMVELGDEYDPLDIEIWRRHSEGESAHAIARAIRQPSVKVKNRIEFLKGDLLLYLESENERDE